MRNDASVFRARRRRLAAAFVFAVLAAGDVTGQQISSHVIAGGGGTSHSPGGCRVLESSIGEPAAGRASGSDFIVTAGYWAGPGGQRRDSLFDSGFEGCD
jgi:hypothetical protein